MANAVKKDRPSKKRKDKYEKKLKVNSSFLDIVKAAVKNADDKSAKKK